MTIKEEIYEMMLKTDFAYKIQEEPEGNLESYEVTVTDSLVVKEILKLIDDKYEGYGLSLIVNVCTDFSHTSVTVYGKQVTGNSTHVISDIELLHEIISKVKSIKISSEEKYNKVIEFLFKRFDYYKDLMEKEEGGWKLNAECHMSGMDEVICMIKEMEENNY